MKYVVANWKMYMGTRGGVALVRAIMRAYRGKADLPEVVICPGFLALGELKKVLSRSRINLGAQDAFWEEEGAHTGSVAPKMLKETGCSYVILGHSERRAELGETNEMVAKKVSTALESGLRVILCVGESEEDHGATDMEAIIQSQLKESLAGVTLKDPTQLLVAYEPIWAISSKGHGSEDLEEVLVGLRAIREMLEDLYGPKGAKVPLLYGGSVDGENAYTYLREDLIDGVLVGSASIKIHHVTKIIEAALRAMRPKDV